MSASSSASEQAACHARTGLSARMTWGQGQGKEGENAGGAHGDAVRARLLVAAPREAGLGLGQVGVLRRVHGGVRPLHPEPHRELRGCGRGGVGARQVAAEALQAAQRPVTGRVEGRGDGHGDGRRWPRGRVELEHQWG